MLLLTLVSCSDVHSEQLTVRAVKEKADIYHKKIIKVKGFLKYENNSGFLYDSKGDAENMNFNAELLIHTELKLSEFNIEKCSGHFVVIEAKLGTGAMTYLYNVENIHIVDNKTREQELCWPN